MMRPNKVNTVADRKLRTHMYIIIGESKECYGGSNPKISEKHGDTVHT